MGACGGRSGGILLGVNKDTFEVSSFSRGEFFVGVEVLQRNNNINWELLVVYSPGHHARSYDFLREIYTKISTSPLPVAVGGF